MSAIPVTRPRQLGPGARRFIVVLFASLAVASGVAIVRLAECRRDAILTAARLGFLAAHPAVLETAEIIESDDEACAIIAEAMLDEESGARRGASSGAKREAARRLLLHAIADRPASAHYRLVLGRSAPSVPGAEALWRKPLELAGQAAPGLDGSFELLASRYLDAWPALSAPDRARAAAALRRAFLDDSCAGRLFPVAAAVLGQEQAPHLLPDDAKVLDAAIAASEARGNARAAEILRVRLARLRGTTEESEISGPRS